MDKFKLIKEESYESLEKYLKKIGPVCDFDNPLAFVDTDDKRYLVTKVEDEQESHRDCDIYMVAYDNGEDIVTAGTHVEGDAFAINTGEVAYRVSDSEHLVCMENQGNNYYEELAYFPRSEYSAVPSFSYSQIDPINRNELLLNYRVNDRVDANSIAPYIGSRNPSLLELYYYNYLLKRSIKYVNAYKDTYLGYIRFINNSILAHPVFGRERIDDLYKVISSRGLRTHVPKELIDLYTGNHKLIKEYKKVTDIYRENTKK